MAISVFGSRGWGDDVSVSVRARVEVRVKVGVTVESGGISSLGAGVKVFVDVVVRDETIVGVSVGDREAEVGEDVADDDTAIATVVAMEVAEDVGVAVSVTVGVVIVFAIAVGVP